VIGVDVSNHQGDIDWPTLASSNVAFAYIKATEGGDFRDKRFQLNWEGAKRAGLARGAYRFFTQCRSGAEQAKAFIAAVPRDEGALPPSLRQCHAMRVRYRPLSMPSIWGGAAPASRSATLFGRSQLF
jgi:lysozyme